MRHLLLPLLISLSSFSYGVNLDSLKAVLQTDIPDTTRVRIKVIIGENTPIFRSGYWDSLATEAKNIGAYNVSAHCYNNIGYITKRKGNLDEALELYRKALEIQQRVDDRRGIASSYNNIGMVYRDKGSIQKAFEMFEKSLAIRKEENLKKDMAISFTNMANILVLQGKESEGIDLLFKALKIREQIEAERDVALTLGEISYVYTADQDYERGLEYAQKSYDKYESMDDKYGMSQAAIYMGNNYLEMGLDSGDSSLFDQALNSYKNSLELSKELDYKRGIGLGLGNIGSFYWELGDLDKSKEYYEKALELYESIGHKAQAITPRIHLSKIAREHGDMETAVRYGREAHQLAQELGFLKDRKNSSLLLSKIYADLNKWENAYQRLHEFVMVEDSLNSIENKKSLIRNEFQYAYDKKVYEDSLQDIQEARIHEAKIAQKDAQLKQEQTQRYALYGGMGILALLGFVIYRGYRSKKQANVIISRQKEEVETQRDLAEEQKKVVEEKNKEILDSITYAKRLQEAILPPKQLVKEWLPQSFILYKPKDIVAGDFYWMETTQGKVYFAAADCTGHGVPGAMVSVVCSNALSKSLIEENITLPGKILDRTRELVIDRFGRSEEEIKDGMDISLCSYNYDTGEVGWAGANNPLWIIRAGSDEVEEIKADKQPIGKYANESPFSTHNVKLEKGDSIYMFSDGFADQFGGEKGKKYKSGKFKKYVLSICDRPMQEQRELINREFEDWKGEIEQLDDVCVIGVKR